MGSTIKVVNAMGEALDVAPEAAEQGLWKGEYRLPKDIEVPLTGADGITSMFPAANVPRALQEGGFRIASSKDQARKRAEDSPVIAFTENLANDLVPVPGAVHALERALGADAEDLAARAETTAGKAGSFAGIAGSLFTGGAGAKAATAGVKAARKLGTELTEGVVEHAAPNLLERAFVGRVGGQAAADATQSLESKFGKLAVEPLEGTAERTYADMGRTVLQQLAPGVLVDRAARTATEAAERVIGEHVQSEIARKAVASGMGRAVEGATYGLGQALDEAALGDAELNAETILANVGAGALVGGFTGGVLRAGVEKTKQVARDYVAEDLTGKIAGSLIGHAVSPGAGAMAGRVIGQKISQGLQIGAAHQLPGLNAINGFIKRADEYLANRILRLSGRSMPQYRAPVEALVTRTTLRMLEGKTAEERRQAFDERVAEITALQDPLSYAQHIEPELGEIANHAPNHALATGSYGQRLLGYLQGQIPQPQVGSTGSMNRLFHKQQQVGGRPDDRAIRQFAEVDRLVQNPQYIFDLVDTGAVRAAHVEALKANYPKLHQRITEGLIENLPQAEQHHTAEQQRAIKTLLGGEVVTPRQRQLRQQVFAPQDPPPSTGRTPPQQSKYIRSSMTLSQNLESES